ncbi:MAG TPA: OmpA family protein [Acidobacteriaceae bacterium]|jgi:peptidoglycan-associated lipoprotein|nr:OmpA family protein [Acidobacteriaceae bacterium]
MISRQSPKFKRIHPLLLSASLALLAATGCHKHANTLPPPSSLPPETAVPAPTATLTADPLAVDQGQSVVLNWRTTDATSVSIDGIGNVAINGTQTVTPASSTNFHLVAKGDGGTTEANVRVTVRVPTVPEMSGTADNTMGTDAAFHAAVKDLFYDYDSYTVRPADEASVAAAAHYLNANPAIKVLIAGYCDDRGSAEYNITLGENRANAAKQALVAAGVSADRIRVVSYGKERQFCTEETDSCWQQNRRAQFTVDR